MLESNIVFAFLRESVADTGSSAIQCINLQSNKNRPNKPKLGEIEYIYGETLDEQNFCSYFSLLHFQNGEQQDLRLVLDCLLCFLKVVVSSFRSFVNQNRIFDAVSRLRNCFGISSIVLGSYFFQALWKVPETYYQVSRTVRERSELQHPIIYSASKAYRAGIFRKRQ